MTPLENDVIIEILSRLPVTTLLRFKSVCKSWNLIIHNTPTFISKHYQTTSSKQGSNQPILISRRDKVTNKRVISLMLRNDHDRTTRFLDDQAHLLTTFVNDMFGHVRLIGPCNGMVCLYGFPDNIALWNPSIREFKILPSSLVQRLPVRIRGGDLGVGFDSAARDLKVLQILFCISSEGHLVYQVEIYSLRTNSWRELENFVPGNIVIYYNTLWSMVYKNEIFCWWAQDCRNIEVILSFDMSKETFQNTPLPSNIGVLGGQPRITRAILPLKESLALIVYHLQELEKSFDIWILNELGGNSESWSKLTSIGPLLGVQRPLGFWNNDDFILESVDGELMVYSCIDKKLNRFGVYGKRNRLEALVHKESLFSVNEVYENL